MLITTHNRLLQETLLHLTPQNGSRHTQRPLGPATTHSNSDTPMRGAEPINVKQPLLHSLLMTIMHTWICRESYPHAFHFLTFLHCGDAHRWLTQAGPRLPLALIRVVHFHGGQRGLLLIHAPEHHHLGPQCHSRSARPCSGQRGQLAPCLAFYIQDLDAVQGHAGLVAAPQHVEQAFVVDGGAVHAAL
ncbi:unnamed protein product [Pleuronectes platessa]|uniref:Uncharacterized protein n=1 Tax=Pleuronectes platessa TaxID=8262 RepID=A0A9N7TY27_PLEPL|nr:unnamed protein product [Pleuronectes platessa]